MKRHAALLLVVCAGSLGLGVQTRADEVTYWNNVLLEGFRTDFGTGCPCPLARAGAMTQAAVYDAVNSIERTHRPYLRFVPASPGASKEAAVATAAHEVMVQLFPNLTADLDTHYGARLALIPNGPAKDEGIAVGRAAAADCLLSRTGDGSEIPEDYTFGGQPGDYRPTFPSFNPVCNPEWRQVNTFCMVDHLQFHVAGPYGYTVMSEFLASPEYAADVNEVKEIGSLLSTTRTDEETRIAFYWANDLNGTSKPPGQLFTITQIVSADHKLTLSENARLFALVGLAMGDAGITAWTMKYGTDIDLWRPISAIREADTDGNDATDVDPLWLPLNPFTPAFPAWASGHATFGGAHAGVMAEFFGTDNVTFTADSEDPYYNALPEHPARTFHSFSEAAWENAISRLYLGVHYRIDAIDGNSAGLKLGHYVGQNFLLERCASDQNNDGAVNSADFFDFLDALLTENIEADFDRNGLVDSQDFFDYINAYFSGCGA